jgi:chromate transporter
MTNGQLFSARWKELAKTFLKLGATSFGGPAIIGIIQAELQERRGWLTRERFLEGLAVVNMLPGGAVMQLCIFIGYQRAGWRGGVLAGLSFLLPPFCIMLALTLLYASYGTLPVVRDALYGLGPVVLGIFVVTAFRLGTVALTNLYQLAIGCVAAVMLAFTPPCITPRHGGCAPHSSSRSRLPRGILPAPYWRRRSNLFSYQAIASRV